MQELQASRAHAPRCVNPPPRACSEGWGESEAVPAPARHGRAVGQVFGGFERHTRGIGGKLLKQMGYRRGGGLGRHGQGIVEPLQPAMLKRRAGLGATR